MVAQRRRLRGLPAQLRRLRRRRRRRHRRAAREAAVPGRPRCRRALDHARGTRRRWPTAATTSPTTATSIRGSARSRTPTPCSPTPTRSACGSSSTSSPNHTLRASTPGSPRRWRRARAPRSGTATSSATGRAGGEQPPNDWISAFGGPAWTRVREADGRPGSGTCTCSPPSSPTWTGANRGVREDFDDVLRFWLDRGVDGLRVDAAPAMAKVPGLPDAGHGPGARFESRTWVGNPHWDVDGVHDILRRWRRHRGHLRRRPAVRRRGGRPDPERLSQYVRPDEMHTASTSTTSPRRGSRAGCARSSTRARGARAGSARHRPGCCPATTRPGT